MPAQGVSVFFTLCQARQSCGKTSRESNQVIPDQTADPDGSFASFTFGVVRKHEATAGQRRNQSQAGVRWGNERPDSTVDQIFILRPELRGPRDPTGG
jgi:hypothetical protein